MCIDFTIELQLSYCIISFIIGWLFEISYVQSPDDGCVFVALLSFNWFYFMRGDRYLKMVDRYQGIEKGSKRNGRMYFWMYFIGTILLLVIAM